MPGPVHIQDVHTGAVYPCEVGQAVLVGRTDPTVQAEIACNDPHVSRRHCELYALPDGRLRIVDRSSYGTYVNGQKLEGEGLAAPGDKIVLGYQYTLRVVDTNAVFAPTHADHSASGRPATFGDAVTAGDPGLGAGTLPPVIDGRYQLKRELGRGGMGVVYQAGDLELGRECAIKVLNEVGQFDKTERFKREARLAAKLGDYPAIVKVYDCGTLYEGHALYLVMDYVDGTSLARLARMGVDRKLGVRLVARTARAVDYAHVRGVVHRDLKPENVLVTPEWQIRLTDFGIAKEDGSGLTMTGTAMGTPNFMAPEQIEDSKRVGPPADVYGLGGLLYAVLTGKPPYSGKRVGTILRRVQRGDLTPPREHVPDLDPTLDALCVRALSVDPANRPASAASFAKELEAWLKENDAGASGQVRLELPKGS